ncbi:Glycoside hydrolase [Parasponia andersonii]|uniref:Pectinesterase n=1 Tax=Parasponia andersonii TaxID=3476 RepID=A0A2P5CQY6_PARAD|nr:Glycoside hydrolase [Parasponia andersonii]
MSTYTLVAVTGKGFLPVNVTVRNTAGASKHQAVAVRNSADLSTFYSCSSEANQDTLYAHSLRQFYRDCDIYGTVDFIFGNGSAVVQNCKIYPRLPLPGQFNAITWHFHPQLQHRTRRRLGRREHRRRRRKRHLRQDLLGEAVEGILSNNEFIDPVGWREWNETEFTLNTLYFAEFDNWGPGSDTTNRVLPCHRRRGGCEFYCLEVFVR